ncbi:crossover junction endonuclease eme1 [Bulinus truncatus]|nr:crossover junction endonuclease eme1 [Bulinus truncatus]
MAEMLTVFVDPAVAPENKQKELILKACADIGIKCDFVPQRFERTISWMPPLKASASVSEDITKEIMAVLSAEDAISMIKGYVQSKHGDAQPLTLTSWIMSLQAMMPGHNITLMIVGLNKYFSGQKSKANRKLREAATGQTGRQKKKNNKPESTITCQEAEEAFVELQLLTGCVAQHVASDEDLAEQIKYFTKSVKSKPDKKDRFDNAFSFLDENTNSVFVNKQGQGLRKVWKHQLMQFKNFGAEMADAVSSVYPSPYLLYQACKESSGKGADDAIADINVRRNASVISTNRKIGKEQARRIYTFFTSKDPDQAIK